MAIIVRPNLAALKRAIALTNISQNAFARKTGVSPSYMSQVLMGIKNPSPQTRGKILSVLTPLTFDDLFTIEDQASGR